MGATWFITGTDTGVGKTLLTGLLARRLLATGGRFRAVKPFCSGGREDAETLFAAQGGRVPMDEINPWHFRAPLAPLVAARRQGVRVTLEEAVAFLRRSARGCDPLLVEGAGGLLSPLGEGFSALELIQATRARVLVVCPDRLGAINQSLLVFAALPKRVAARAKLVLSATAEPDGSCRTNRTVLAELLGADRVHVLPRSGPEELAAIEENRMSPGLKRSLDALLAWTRAPGKGFEPR